MSDAETLEDIPWGDEPEERVKLAAPRKCRRHEWVIANAFQVGRWMHDPEWRCRRCLKAKDEAVARRGRNNRKRGNSHELAIARRYGGDKVGPLGLPEDIRGIEFRSQVKTHQRSAPAEWRKAFAALEAGRDGRTPRLILRFLPGPGLPADDYIVLRGSDWLDRYGRDEEAA